MVTRVLALALHWQSGETSFDNMTHMFAISLRSNFSRLEHTCEIFKSSQLGLWGAFALGWMQNGTRLCYDQIRRATNTDNLDWLLNKRSLSPPIHIGEKCIHELSVCHWEGQRMQGCSIRDHYICNVCLSFNSQSSSSERLLLGCFIWWNLKGENNW
jgi:hypothetical protein